MPTYQVIVRVEVPNVEAETEDDAINFVTEAIEETFAWPVSFDMQSAKDYSG